MRDMTMGEVELVSGGDGTERFNSCMANNWWADTSKGAVGGAVFGAIFGPGAFLGFVGGAMAGSTSALVYCATKAL